MYLKSHQPVQHFMVQIKLTNQFSYNKNKIIKTNITTLRTPDELTHPSIN